MTNRKLSNALTHYAKLVLSFITQRKCQDPRDPLRSLINSCASLPISSNILTNRVAPFSEYKPTIPPIALMKGSCLKHQLLNSLWWPINVINSVVNTKLPSLCKILHGSILNLVFSILLTLSLPGSLYKFSLLYTVHFS